MPGSRKLICCVLDSGEGGPVKNERRTLMMSSVRRSHFEDVGDKDRVWKRAVFRISGALGRRARIRAEGLEVSISECGF